MNSSIQPSEASSEASSLLEEKLIEHQNYKDEKYEAIDEKIRAAGVLMKAYDLKIDCINELIKSKKQLVGVRAEVPIALSAEIEDLVKNRDHILVELKEARIQMRKSRNF